MRVACQESLTLTRRYIVLMDHTLTDSPAHGTRPGTPKECYGFLSGSPISVLSSSQSLQHMVRKTGVIREFTSTFPHQTPNSSIQTPITHQPCPLSKAQLVKEALEVATLALSLSSKPNAPANAGDTPGGISLFTYDSVDMTSTPILPQSPNPHQQISTHHPHPQP